MCHVNILTDSLGRYIFGENIRNIVRPRAGALVQELTDVLYHVYVEISPETTNVQIRSPDVVGSTHLIKVLGRLIETKEKNITVICEEPQPGD